MRKAFFALFVALVSTCALALGSTSVAGASTNHSLLGLVQSQEGQNTNRTDQQSEATATTNQRNLNVPIAILSPGANSGDVDQSNRSDTSVSSSNRNSSDQGIDQRQRGRLFSWGAGLPGLDQRQQAANANETSQVSSAEATTEQANVNVPIAILSPGANSGDVDQSNRADTDVRSSNGNRSDQWVGQAQQGSVVSKGHEPRCEKDCGHGKDRGPNKPCSCEPKNGPSLSEDQQAANTNETQQHSSAEATTDQSNVNKPISILDFGSFDRHDDGKDWKKGNDWGHGKDGKGSHVHQSNSADTTVGSHNTNDSVQGIQQVQHGAVGGLGGNHSGQHCC
jgi:hypothetical protein